ncbi:hypothetical protein [Bifidobacterium biavatii]|uniref:Uncharacterized protein n=1 Tax=Bifidobacterium biavatii DSM 23969 TaxID=1437608 RepID=A0A087A4M7_9BIFI|nr:hypothetical protein [Bifidobacterium biavatii]KFI53727.1 hypothetical protein BBIA_1325 [Bifidobacterium biavatii DSM 23969]
MAYCSINEMQKALAGSMFANRPDAKKAAGRALGAMLEVITFYLLKDYGLVTNIAIERSLKEYANESVGHNVEFTLHASAKIGWVPRPANGQMTAKTVNSELELLSEHIIDEQFKEKDNRPFRRDGFIKNAATLYEGTNEHGEDVIINAYPDTEHGTADICQLQSKPFAMFECKRVGVEEGMKKGPQTIEKAKQGAYVALAASKLQKFRRSDGKQMGILEKRDGSYLIKPYDEMLQTIIDDLDPSELDGIVLTVGVISDHGNWFSSDRKNKETQVLSDAYDWLLFLTDDGLAAFIQEVLLGGDASMNDVRDAFRQSTIEKNAKFTKTILPANADRALTRYFAQNRDRIASWFNIITPAGGTLDQLFGMLKRIAERE